MPNPTKGWDKVPIFGWYMELDGVTPKVGTVKLTLAQRVTSTDGRTIFPGGTITATLGGTDNDTAVLNQIRAAMSAVDQAAVEAGGGTFDAAAWGADWDARLPGAFFTSFPASDDPDIVEDGFQVKVEEKLASGDGKIYYITPLLADLSNPIPGVNLGTIAVPPGAPTAPAPIYQKGQPGGVASLDDTGVVPLAQIPSGISASASVDTLTGATDVGKSLMKAADAAAARAATGAGTSSLVVGTTAGTAADAAATTAALGLKADAAATTTALGLKLDAAQKGAANGVATLDGSLKIPSAQMPDIAIVNYLGPVGSQAAMLALTGQRGDWATRTDLGTTWTITGDDPTQLGNWVQLSYPTAPVTSVATRTGAVTLAKADVGLSNVDNTSDLAKPVSLATQEALDAKSQDVVYDGTSWPAASAAAVVRRFISTGYPSAPAPTGLSGADLWFRDRSAV